MKKVDIVETFEQHESVLRSVFNSYAKLPDQKIEPRKDELDYLMILDALVDGHVQTELYQKVRERFCPSDGITSNVSVVESYNERLKEKTRKLKIHLKML